MMKLSHKNSLPIQEHSSVKQYLNQSRSHVIKKLKTYLISRNPRKQVLALNTIKNELKSKTSELTAEVLICTDIPGLLCDVMNNHNPALISQVISCLILLSRHQLFFQHKHAAVVVETTCRTVRILSKDPANLHVIYIGLQLLCQTLPRSSEERSVNLDSLLGLVKDLLHNPMFQQVHMNVIFLLQTTVKICDPSHKDIGPILFKALHLLYKLKTNNVNRFNKYIQLVVELVRLSLSKIYSSDVDKLQFQIKELIIRLIKFSIIPYIQEVDVRRCHAGFVRRQLSCLLALYQYLDDGELLKMSTFLGSRGFLTLLPHLNLHYNGTLKSTVTSLLSQILIRLSVSTLGCSSHDCQLVSAGLTELPPDVTDWPHHLTRRQANTQYAVLVYLYFVVLCAKSFRKSPSFFPALCHFVKHNSSPPAPPLLKSIWLLYAVGALSSDQLQSAGRVVVQWLRTATVPLTSVYTHHPAILLWSFSAQVTNAILQIDIMSLWLKDEGVPSLKEIENLALNKRQASFRLLDVIGCCDQETLPQALLVIQGVLAKSTPERVLEISERVWTSLAPTLSALDHPHPVSRANNVCCLVWLACKLVPAHPDTLVLMRLAYQLLRTFRLPVLEPLPLLRCQLFKLTNTIAIKMNQAKDYRVLEMFVKDDSLVESLLSSLGCGDDKVTLPALRLLAYLQYAQKMYNIQVMGCKYLSEDILLRLMASPQPNNVFACMQLLRSLQPAPALVALPADASHRLILTLYLDVQMLTVKSSDSWRCLVVLLDYCKTHKTQLEAHLLTQPWTHMVVLFTLQRGGLGSVEVLQFLVGWLGALHRRRLVPRAVNYSRALYQDRLSATVTHIARALLEHKEVNELHRDIASKIVMVGGNIPPEVVQSLKTEIVRETVL